MTSPDENEISSEDLYEKLYCGRGDTDNRVKLFLFADRTGTSGMRSNQLRLYFSSFAYVLMHALRRLELAGTEMELRRELTNIFPGFSMSERCLKCPGEKFGLSLH